MAINLVEEVLKHNDEEIIEYLATIVAGIRAVHMTAAKNQDPAFLYTATGDVSEAYAILKALDRRNKEHKLK